MTNDDDGRCGAHEVPHRPRAVLPPPGPVWFPSVMGIGAAATMLQSSWHQTAIALVMLATCWVALVALLAGFGVRCLRRPGLLRASFVEMDQVPMWGTVAMAILTAGSATSVVLPVRWPGLTGLA